MRKRRGHLPGAVFHLTARAQGREALFDESIRAPIMKLSLDAVLRDGGGARVLAIAVMSNHLHLVLWQGEATLGRIMQIVLRRTALLVQSRTGRKDHVFGQRFRDYMCTDARHVRNAIVYTHLNPVRHNVCDATQEYAWTSHHQYAASDEVLHPALAVREGLALFAARHSDTIQDHAAAYSRYVQWRCAADAVTSADSDTLPREPDILAGDMYCLRAFRLPTQRQGPDTRRKDLQAIALEVLGEDSSPLPLDVLRSDVRTRPVTALRRRIVRAMAVAGYGVSQIANYLRMTPSGVSHAIRRDSDWTP